MISTAILKLGSCNIQDTLSCLVWNQMKEAKQILAGIPKSHAPADTGFIVGSRTGHVEGHHALVLMPDIDHAV